MGKSVRVTVSGVEFNSLRSACLYYGISDACVRRRLKAGWSIEEALLTSVGKGVEKIVVSVGGLEFSSLKEASNYYNVDYSVAKKRHTSGWSLEEVFGLKEREKCVVNGKGVEVDGVKFSSIKEASEYFGVAYSMVKQRLNRGLSVKEALGIDEIGICVEGKYFKTIKEASNYYGKKYGKVKNRVRYGWSIEEALDLVERDNYGRGVKVEFLNYLFSSIDEASSYFGIEATTARVRLRKGWTYEEAFGLKPREVDGVIDKKVWNLLGCSVKIENYLGNNIYKCIDNDNIRYYSHDELVEKFKEGKKNG